MKRIFLPAVGLLLLFACGANEPAQNTTDTTASSSQSNVTSDTSKASDWISLFDGSTTAGWHTYGLDHVGAAWKVEDSSLHLDASYKKDFQTSEGGDIITSDEFDNFDLKLQWKIAPKGNSGIMIYVQDDPKKYKYTFWTGPEMQVLDNDGHDDGKIPKHRAGNLYDLIAGKEGVVKPVGEWNQVEIIANKGKLDFYLNDVNVVSTTMWDDNWKKMIAGSKFKEWPDFGTFTKGHIALQDHGNDVWYKNIMIKKL